MSMQEWLWVAGSAVGITVGFRAIWDVVGYIRLTHALNRQVQHEKELAILMEGKDLAHFLFDNGLGADPDIPEPQPPLPSVRGIQSVELD